MDQNMKNMKSEILLPDEIHKPSANVPERWMSSAAERMMIDQCEHIKFTGNLFVMFSTTKESDWDEVGEVLHLISEIVMFFKKINKYIFINCVIFILK